jgi:hypothetical protein
MRMLAVVAFALAAAWSGAATDARAQEQAPTAQAEADAGPLHVDPATGERFRWTRPDEPMRRGPLAVPSWAVVTLGTLVAGAAAAALVLRARRRRGG